MQIICNKLIVLHFWINAAFMQDNFNAALEILLRDIFNPGKGLNKCFKVVCIGKLSQQFKAPLCSKRKRLSL